MNLAWYWGNCNFWSRRPGEVWRRVLHEFGVILRELQLLIQKAKRGVEACATWISYRITVGNGLDWLFVPLEVILVVCVQEILKLLFEGVSSHQRSSRHGSLRSPSSHHLPSRWICYEDRCQVLRHHLLTSWAPRFLGGIDCIEILVTSSRSWLASFPCHMSLRDWPAWRKEDDINPHVLVLSCFLVVNWNGNKGGGGGRRGGV